MEAEVLALISMVELAIVGALWRIYNKLDDKITNNTSSIDQDIRVIKENHLHHIEKDVAVLTTNMSWVKTNLEEHKQDTDNIYSKLEKNKEDIYLKLDQIHQTMSSRDK